MVIGFGMKFRQFVHASAFAVVAHAVILPLCSAHGDVGDYSRAETDATSDFITSTLKSGEGLPANEIQDLRETADGYLWLGTPQGLVRFDGIRFQSFFTKPTGARYSTRVDPLEVDAKGRLWFAPDEVGVMYYERGAFQEVLTNVIRHADATPLGLSRTVTRRASGRAPFFLSTRFTASTRRSRMLSYRMLNAGRYV